MDIRRAGLSRVPGLPEDSPSCGNAPHAWRYRIAHPTIRSKWREKCIRLRMAREDVPPDRISKTLRTSIQRDRDDRKNIAANVINYDRASSFIYEGLVSTPPGLT